MPSRVCLCKNTLYLCREVSVLFDTRMNLSKLLNRSLNALKLWKFRSGRLWWFWRHLRRNSHQCIGMKSPRVGAFLWREATIKQNVRVIGGKKFQKKSQLRKILVKLNWILLLQWSCYFLTESVREVRLPQKRKCTQWHQIICFARAKIKINSLFCRKKVKHARS